MNTTLDRMLGESNVSQNMRLTNLSHLGHHGGLHSLSHNHNDGDTNGGTSPHSPLHNGQSISSVWNTNSNNSSSNNGLNSNSSSPPTPGGGVGISPTSATPGGGFHLSHNSSSSHKVTREYESPKLDLIDEQIRNVDQICLQVSPTEHPLQHAYSLWVSRRQSPKQTGTVQRFEDSLKLLCTFKSVEKFWKYYTHLKYPSELNGHVDYHLFKYGIKPMWEDTANREGGKWIVRLRKGVASRCWENVLLAIVGEQFIVGDEICGAVISVRYNQEDIISIWNRTSNDAHVRQKIIETLRRVLNLPAHYQVEYKQHNRSLIDNSSFRNTDVVRPANSDYRL